MRLSYQLHMGLMRAGPRIPMAATSRDNGRWRGRAARRGSCDIGLALPCWPARFARESNDSNSLRGPGRLGIQHKVELCVVVRTAFWPRLLGAMVNHAAGSRSLAHCLTRAAPKSKCFLFVEFLILSKASFRTAVVFLVPALTSVLKPSTQLCHTSKSSTMALAP
jgi:hypothetical protein